MYISTQADAWVHMRLLSVPTQGGALAMAHRASCEAMMTDPMQAEGVLGAACHDVKLGILSSSIDDLQGIVTCRNLA